MDTVADQLKALLPGVTIEAGGSLCWSPQNKTVTYRGDDISQENIWGLLHEAGHAKLGHESYDSDIDLLLKEVAAWTEAQNLANKVNQKIDSDHIQDCLDTYRDWLHQRSTCPRCGIVTMQHETNKYSCYNCHNSWTVSKSRLCRTYRLRSGTSKNRPDKSAQAVFE